MCPTITAAWTFTVWCNRRAQRGSSCRVDYSLNCPQFPAAHDVANSAKPTFALDFAFKFALMELLLEFLLQFALHVCHVIPPSTACYCSPTRHSPSTAMAVERN